MKYVLASVAALLLIGHAAAQHGHGEKGPNGGPMQDVAGVVAEFADAIAAKRKPLTDAVAGIHVVSLLEAAEQSLRSEGRRVRL